MTIEELSAYGLTRMDDEQIEMYLKVHHIGVLALPAEGAPYQIPMAYGYDGGTSLYFNFVTGQSSRKVELSETSGKASFLVYRAETIFNWRSVALSGSIRPLQDDEYADLTEAQLPAWRPELLETASESEPTRIFEFEIEEQSGVRHAIQPPADWQRVSPERSG